MSKDYQDLQSLDPQEVGSYRSAQSFSNSGFSLPSAPRSSRLLYILFALCAILLTILIIVVTVNNSNVKETQKKQEENLGNFNLSVQSHFQAVRSDEGSLQEKINNLETKINKLESDKAVETVQEAVKELKNTVEKLTCDIKKLSTNDSSIWCCPDDWEEFSGGCYLFSFEGRSWEDSKKFCQSKNSYLLVINTAAEQRFVEKKTMPRYTWIGLTDTDGTWSWLDGTSYDSTPKNWISGQPDEYYGHGLGGGEDCAHLHHNGQWNDDHCSRTYNAVCERKIV